MIGIFGVPYPCPPGPFELAMLLASRFAERRSRASVTGFFELGAGTAAMVAGRSLADPPDVRLSEPGPEHPVAKRAFEVDRLRSWFGR